MMWSQRNLVAGVLCGMSLISAVPLRAQSLIGPSRAIQSIPLADQRTGVHRYLGAAECELCHSRGPTDTQIAEGVENRTCLTELVIWRDADKHADAYKSLTGQLGKQIGESLKVDVNDPSAGCISCHATPDAAGGWSVEGVSCEACHGPSSNWSAPHREFPEWTNTPSDEKAKLGWIDVRSPVMRAELCISCHVGSPRHGRIITHDMYAVGHPPLAGFELESFADQMPRHWRYPYEKSNNAQPSFQRTRNVLAAAVVSMRMSAELAAADAAAPQQNKRWPEFARLDCFACHHELQSPGWRQLRMQSGSPGRPTIAVVCLPLVRVAATVAAGTPSIQNLDLVLKQLQTPFKSNPFGDATKLAQPSQAVVEWCRSAEQRFESIDITAPQAREVLRQIAEQAAREFHDYDTARQLLGAWLIVYGELNAHGELQMADAQQRRIDELLSQMENAYPQIAALRRVTLVCGADPPAKRDYNELLVQQYKNRIEYDPPQFKAMMTELARLLPK